MVDSRPFEDRHSLLKRVTLRAEIRDWPLKLLSWEDRDASGSVTEGSNNNNCDGLYLENSS